MSNIAIDTALVINRLLELDNKKKIDTATVVYKLGLGEVYLTGQLIQRGIVPIKDDTIKLNANDSVNYFVMVPKESQIRVTFLDGTKAWLNAGTVLSFSGNLAINRNLRINGEGYFNVKAGRDSLTIKTPGNHRFILKQGILNINTFDAISPVPNPDDLAATDQELDQLASRGMLYDINCNPCRLDSLINVWNEKYNHYVVVDKGRLKECAEPVYVNMVHASFIDIAGNILSKQSKLGCYFNPTGEIIITGKDSLEALNYFANIKSGGVHVYCGNCNQEMQLKGYECLTFGKYELLKKQKCDPTIANSWTKGYFEQVPIQTTKSLYASIGRWYDVDISYQKSSTPISFSGKLPLNASLKDILKVLEVNDIKYKLGLSKNGDKLKIQFN